MKTFKPLSKRWVILFIFLGCFLQLKANTDSLQGSSKNQRWQKTDVQIHSTMLLDFPNVWWGPQGAALYRCYSFSVCHKLKKWCYLGAGVGFDYYHVPHQMYFPVFARAGFEVLPLKKFSPVYMQDAGYSAEVVSPSFRQFNTKYYGGFLVHEQVGLRIKMIGKLNVLLLTGVKTQHSKSVFTISETERELTHSFNHNYSFTLGVQF